MDLQGSWQETCRSPDTGLTTSSGTNPGTVPSRSSAGVLAGIPLGGQTASATRMGGQLQRRGRVGDFGDEGGHAASSLG